MEAAVVSAALKYAIAWKSERIFEPLYTYCTMTVIQKVDRKVSKENCHCGHDGVIYEETKIKKLGAYSLKTLQPSSNLNRIWL